MGFFKRLNWWQKGFIFGFLFTLLLSIIYTVILIFIDIKLANQGLPHYCFMFSETLQCSLEDAIFTRIGFLFVLMLIFGIPAGIFSAFIGFFIEKMALK